MLNYDKAKFLMVVFFLACLSKGLLLFIKILAGDLITPSTIFIRFFMFCALLVLIDWKTLSIIKPKIENLNWLKATGFIFGTFFLIPWIASSLFQIYNSVLSIQFEDEVALATSTIIGFYIFGLIISSIGSSSFQIATKHKQKALKIKKTKLVKEVGSLPNVFKTAEYLIYISLIIGFVKLISEEFLTEHSLIIDPFILTIVIFTILLIGFLGFKVGQGRNWARITLLVFFVFGLIFFPFSLLEEFQMSPIIGILSLLQATLQLYVLIILFTGEAKEWFMNQKLDAVADVK